MTNKEYDKLTTPTASGLTDANWLAWEAVLISQIKASFGSISHLEAEAEATEALLKCQCDSLEKARAAMGDYNDGYHSAK